VKSAAIAPQKALLNFDPLVFAGVPTSGSSWLPK
jgi:hypothetical protein